MDREYHDKPWDVWGSLFSDKAKLNGFMNVTISPSIAGSSHMMDLHVRFAMMCTGENDWISQSKHGEYWLLGDTNPRVWRVVPSPQYKTEKMVPQILVDHPTDNLREPYFRNPHESPKLYRMGPPSYKLVYKLPVTSS